MQRKNEKYYQKIVDNLLLKVSVSKNGKIFFWVILEFNTNLRKWNNFQGVRSILYRKIKI